LKETLPPSSAMKTLVPTPFHHFNDCFIAGLTVGDPVLRTGNPLSVELGPGKIFPPYINMSES